MNFILLSILIYGLHFWSVFSANSLRSETLYISSKTFAGYLARCWLTKMKTKLKWLADEAESMEPEWAAGMPEAPGRGGTGKMKTVLGMIHKVEPDPACPCSPMSWLGRPSVRWKMGGDRGSGWVAFILLKPYQDSIQRGHVNLTVFVTRNYILGKWAATLCYSLCQNQVNKCFVWNKCLHLKK